MNKLLLCMAVAVGLIGCTKKSDAVLEYKKACFDNGGVEYNYKTGCTFKK